MDRPVRSDVDLNWKRALTWDITRYSDEGIGPKRNHSRCLAFGSRCLNGRSLTHGKAEWDVEQADSHVYSQRHTARFEKSCQVTYFDELAMAEIRRSNVRKLPWIAVRLWRAEKLVVGQQRRTRCWFMATSEEAWKLAPGFLESPSRLNRDHDETGRK